MKTLIDALTTLANHAPSPLRAPSLPPLPGPEALTRLAGVMGGDPASIIEDLGEHGRQRSELDSIIRQSHPLVSATMSDLLDIGEGMIATATSLIPQLLMPNPAVQARARVALSHTVHQGLRMAEQRMSEFTDSLEPLILRAQRLEAAPDPYHPSHSPPPQTHNAQPSVATVQEPAASSTSSSDAGDAAVVAALSQVGTPYQWGGIGNGGFDCSGLTQWAYRQVGIELPRLAEEQTVGRQVSAHELQPGDLAVWDGHVAMYTGNGHIVEAGDPVQTNPLRTSNMGMAFKGFWRPTG